MPLKLNRSVQHESVNGTVVPDKHLVGGRRPPAVSQFFRWKGFIDRPLAATILVITAPLIGLLWILVKCSSPGPGFYGQRRTGRFGRPFVMFKLRSMRNDAEAVTGAIWSTATDPRVTPLGRFLRKYHLDELPQLINVVKGEMSLVGPRPERPEFVEVLVTKLPDYEHRLAVLPGVTGLAQVNLPPDTDLNSVARKLVLDLEYLRDANLSLELRLILCTATRIIKLPTIHLLRLGRHVTLPPVSGRLGNTPSQVEQVPANGSMRPVAGSHVNGNGHKPSRSSRKLRRRPR